MQLVGLRKASTFNGFCNEHDTKLFKSVETQPQPLKPGDVEQVAALGLRVCAYEWHRKKTVRRFYGELMKRGKGVLHPNGMEFVKQAAAEVDLFLNCEGPKYFEYYLKELRRSERGKIEGLSYCWAVVAKNLNISSATSICPWGDDFGEKYEYGEPQPLVAATIIPEVDRTHVVLSCPVAHSNEAQVFFETLKNSEKTAWMVNHLAITESEDTCVAPKIWEAVAGENQDAIINATRPSWSRGRIAPGNEPQLIEFDGSLLSVMS